MSTFVRFEDPATDRMSKDYGPFSFVQLKGGELRVFDEKDNESTLASFFVPGNGAVYGKWELRPEGNSPETFRDLELRQYSDVLVFDHVGTPEQLAEEEYKELEKIKEPTAEQSRRMAELRAKHGFYIASLRTPRNPPLTEGPVKLGNVRPPATTPKPPMNKVPVKPRLDPGVLRAESEAP